MINWTIKSLFILWLCTVWLVNVSAQIPADYPIDKNAIADFVTFDDWDLTNYWNNPSPDSNLVSSSFNQPWTYNTSTVTANWVFHSWLVEYFRETSNWIWLDEWTLCVAFWYESYPTRTYSSITNLWTYQNWLNVKYWYPWGDTSDWLKSYLELRQQWDTSTTNEVQFSDNIITDYSLHTHCLVTQKQWEKYLRKHYVNWVFESSVTTNLDHRIYVWIRWRSDVQTFVDNISSYNRILSDVEIANHRWYFVLWQWLKPDNTPTVQIWETCPESSESWFCNCEQPNWYKRIILSWYECTLTDFDNLQDWEVCDNEWSFCVCNNQPIQDGETCNITESVENIFTDLIWWVTPSWIFNALDELKSMALTQIENLRVLLDLSYTSWQYTVSLPFFNTANWQFVTTTKDYSFNLDDIDLVDITTEWNYTVVTNWWTWVVNRIERTPWRIFLETVLPVIFWLTYCAIILWIVIKIFSTPIKRIVNTLQWFVFTIFMEYVNDDPDNVLSLPLKVIKIVSILSIIWWASLILLSATAWLFWTFKLWLWQFMSFILENIFFIQADMFSTVTVVSNWLLVALASFVLYFAIKRFARTPT